MTGGARHINARVHNRYPGGMKSSAEDELVLGLTIEHLKEFGAWPKPRMFISESTTNSTCAPMCRRALAGSHPALSSEVATAIWAKRLPSAECAGAGGGRPPACRVPGRLHRFGEREVRELRRPARGSLSPRWELLLCQHQKEALGPGRRATPGWVEFAAT